MDKVRLGVLGAGNIAATHMKGYLLDPRCEVVAVCDTDESIGRRAADAWGAKAFYADLDAMLDDSSLHAIEVLTPTNLHHEHVIAALEAGKHVSVQKPAATSVEDVRAMGAAAVQAVVRRRDLFMEPCAAIFEYEDPMVLGTMEVQYAPGLYIRSSYYGADEFFEITGDEGQIWVTRATGEMLDLPPVMLFTGNERERRTTEFRDLDADWGAGFVRSAQHFVDSLVHGTPADMSPESAAKVLQLCFAVYRASETGAPVDPRTVAGSVTPTGWADW